MTRYIDADEVYEIAKTEHKDFAISIADLTSLRELLEDTPTADEVEVRHGEGVNKGDYAVCTECGERSGTQYDGVEPIPLMTKFCSNCGAKMDGERKEQG